MKDKILSVFKFILAVSLFPVVIGTTQAFWESFSLIKGGCATAFGWGVASYLILHILLFEPVEVFDKGKKISEKAFGFFAPLFQVTGFCIPIFTIFSFVFYVLASHFWKEADLFLFFTFLAAFTFTMHIALTARSLRKKNPGILKENYIFSILFIYIVNIVVLAGAYAFLKQEFSFAAFFNNAVDIIRTIYVSVFTQLFVVKK